VKDDKLVVAGPGKDILICPYASQAFRNIPSNLINEISGRCLQSGFNPVVYDDEISIPFKIPAVIRAKKSFQDLRLSMENAHAIISADSLGTHLAAFISRPVFVVSPYIKTAFWLPPSAYEKKHWGLFLKKSEMLNSLDKFFIDLKNYVN
jgi:ADP-heptose:LPS heptosyltransferase